MWECMVLAVKVGIGGILWGILFFIALIIIGGIVYLINKERIPKKPKYEGDPIVIKGGKKKDE